MTLEAFAGLERLIKDADVRSMIRWAGSKKKLLPRLAEYWTAAPGRYVEPFAGSAALFFHLQPSIALLNDLNGELIGAIRVLRDAPEEIYHLIAAMPRSPEHYYGLRSLDPMDLNEKARAARFFFLNRNCFNGIYRVNRSGRFNVPYASSRQGALPDKSEWIAAAQGLQTVQLCTEDFEVFCRREVQRDDFVYLDPPYAVSNRRIFRQYSANSFGTEDMARLADLLSELDQRGAKFVVSYALSPEGRQLGQPWNIRHASALRNIAGFHEHRRHAKEMFISNFTLPKSSSVKV